MHKEQCSGFITTYLRPWCTTSCKCSCLQQRSCNSVASRSSRRTSSGKAPSPRSSTLICVTPSAARTEQALHHRALYWFALPLCCRPRVATLPTIQHLFQLRSLFYILADPFFPRHRRIACPHRLSHGRPVEPPKDMHILLPMLPCEH